MPLKMRTFHKHLGPIRLSIILMIAFSSICISSEQAPSPKKPPNIMILLADDMGYSDLGCFGS